MTKNTAFNFKKCTSEIIENIVKSKKVEAKCELKEGKKKLKTFLDDLFDSGSISIDNTKDKYLLNCAGRFLREEVLKDFIKGDDYLQFAIFKYRNKLYVMSIASYAFGGNGIKFENIPYNSMPKNDIFDMDFYISNKLSAKLQEIDSTIAMYKQKIIECQKRRHDLQVW